MPTGINDEDKPDFYPTQTDVKKALLARTLDCITYYYLLHDYSRYWKDARLVVDKFIFHVDGTHISRQEIDMTLVFLADFCAERDVYLVTGSDRDKTIEQVGEEIYSQHKEFIIVLKYVWEGSKCIQVIGK